MAQRAETGRVPKPAPAPTEVSRFFWDAAREHRLMIQRCDDCAYYIHPPMVVCPKCQSDRLSPTEVSGKGTVYSFSVVQRAFHPGFAADMPYVLALVDLPEQAGVRLVTNIVDCPIDALQIGMAVEATFEDREGHTVPLFRPAR